MTPIVPNTSGRAKMMADEHGTPYGQASGPVNVDGGQIFGIGQINTPLVVSVLPPTPSPTCFPIPSGLQKYFANMEAEAQGPSIQAAPEVYFMGSDLNAPSDFDGDTQAEKMASAMSALYPEMAPRIRGAQAQETFIKIASLVVTAPEGGEVGVFEEIENAGAEALAARADEIHGVLDSFAQNSRTTAVLDTSGGRIVAGGGRDLIPAQRSGRC